MYYKLKNLARLQERPQRLSEKVFEQLFSEAELAKLNPEEMNTYQESLKVYRDNKNTMDYAIKTAVEEATQQARLEARQEGLLEGRKEGKQEGLLEGKQEGRLEIAKELRKNGVSIDLIAKSIGLSEDQIEKL